MGKRGPKPGSPGAKRIAEAHRGSQGHDKKSGFAVNPELAKEAGRRGGINAHKKGTAHKWTSEEAAEAGRKGGSSPKRQLTNERKRFKDKEIMAVYYKVGERPKVVYTPNQLEFFQKLVGGYIERVRISPTLSILCDEEGMIRKKPVNIQLGNFVIVGNFLVVKDTGEEFEGVSQSDINFLEARLMRSIVQIVSEEENDIIVYGQIKGRR